MGNICFSKLIHWEDTVDETAEIDMGHILRGHVSQVKKFRFYLKGTENPMAGFKQDNV